MKKMKYFIVCIVGLFIIYLSYGLDNKIRKFSQNNELAYEVIRVFDGVTFISNGGGSFGYNNYYKWSYAKWMQNEERTFFEKVLFWDVGILYVANNPPKEYEYPRLYN